MRKTAMIKGIMLLAISLVSMGQAEIVKASNCTSEIQLKVQNGETVQKMWISQSGAGRLDYDAASDVLTIMNKKRKEAGVKPLVMDESLLKTANIRAKEIAKKFSHTRPNGSDCFTAYERGGALGENIAMGYTSASSVMKGWMNSQGHRHNILDKGFRSVGIGCYYTGGYYYWVQCFSSEEATPESSAGGATVDTGTASQKPSVSKVSGTSLRAGKKSLTITWKRMSDVKGYEIQIAPKKSFKKGEYTSYKVSASKTKYTLKKCKGKALKSKTKYYVRIRAFKNASENGKSIKVYGKWKTLYKKTK